MKQTELIEAMAKDLKSKKEARAALESLLGAISNALKKGEHVTLTGFGTFKLSHRSARTGRNIQTNEPIQIPAKTVVRFTPGKKLKQACNS